MASVNYPPKVDVHEPFKVHDAGVGKALRDINSRVVDDQIDKAVLADDFIAELFDALPAGYVESMQEVISIV